MALMWYIHITFTTAAQRWNSLEFKVLLFALLGEAPQQQNLMAKVDFYSSSEEDEGDDDGDDDDGEEEEETGDQQQAEELPTERECWL